MALPISPKALIDSLIFCPFLFESDQLFIEVLSILQRQCGSYYRFKVLVLHPTSMVPLLVELMKLLLYCSFHYSFLITVAPNSATIELIGYGLDNGIVLEIEFLVVQVPSHIPVTL